MNRKRDCQGEEVAGVAERPNQFARQQQQTKYVDCVRDEQNGRQQSFRVFEQAIEPSGCRYAVFQILAEPHWIDRKQAAFNPVEEKGNNPATENDKPHNHAAASNAVVFSSRTSSIRLRPERRTVIASRGISSFVPEGGK